MLRSIFYLGSELCKMLYARSDSLCGCHCSMTLVGLILLEEKRIEYYEESNSPFFILRAHFVHHNKL